MGVRGMTAGGGSSTDTLEPSVRTWVVVLGRKHPHNVINLLGGGSGGGVQCAEVGLGSGRVRDAVQGWAAQGSITRKPCGTGQRWQLNRGGSRTYTLCSLAAAKPTR